MTDIEHRGFDKAGFVKPGTTIERVYFAVPGHASIGTEHPTFEAALSAAITEVQERVAKHEAHYANQPGMYVPLPQRVTVDTRWFLRNPHDKGGQDTVAERTTYENLGVAINDLLRRERLAERIGGRR